MCQITNSFCKMLSLHHSVNISLHLIEVPCSKIDYMYCSNMQLLTVQSTCLNCICLHCTYLHCIALMDCWELSASPRTSCGLCQQMNWPSRDKPSIVIINDDDEANLKDSFPNKKMFLAAQRRWWWWWWWHGKKWGMEEASRSRVTLVIPVSQ